VIVVGIDPSLTRTGVATLDAGRPTGLRSVGWGGRDSATFAERSERIVAQCRHVLTLVTPAAELIVIEGPAYASKTGHFFDRGGLWWGLFAGLHARGVPIAVTTPATLKMWATGRGNAEKQDVHAAVKRRWPDIRVRNADEADALVCAEIGAAAAGDPLPFLVTDRHRTNMAKVAWPSQFCVKPEAPQVNA
jgi:Holliday junction resolvasome RuvABC endonuclease subunit